MLRGFYAILDVPPEAVDDVAAVRRRASRLLEGRPCCLQLRAKTAPAATLLTLGQALHPLTRAAAVPLCINDRLDVALRVGAELVHLGQGDLPLEDGLRIAGGRLRIGVSTHDREQAARALAGGADYIGFGPVFPTRTKSNPDPVVGLAALAEVASLAAALPARRVPVIAIGGISLARVAEVAAAGAAGVALIAALEGPTVDVARAGAEINAAFAGR